MKYTYPEYLDELLLVVADSQKGSQVELINLRKIHENRFLDTLDTWLTSAASEFHRMGYGIDWQDTSNQSFRMSGGGLKRAQEIRDAKSAEGLLNRLKRFLADNWIALAAVIVSIVALFKSGS